MRCFLISQWDALRDRKQYSVPNLHRRDGNKITLQMRARLIETLEIDQTKKSARSVRSIDISVWYDYWLLSPIRNMERLYFCETLGGDMIRDIPSPIQPIEIPLDDQALISKAGRVKKMRVSCEMNQERVRYGRSRETTMKMPVSNDAARLSERSWRFFPSAFRSKSFEHERRWYEMRFAAKKRRPIAIVVDDRHRETRFPDAVRNPTTTRINKRRNLGSAKLRKRG